MIAVDHLCAGEPAASAPVFGYRVLASYPHDPTAFTQGLAYASGQLFEGTGNYGRSSLRRVDLTTVTSIRRSGWHPICSVKA